MFVECSQCSLNGEIFFVYTDEPPDHPTAKGFEIPGCLFLKYDTTKQNSEKSNLIIELSYDAPRFLCIDCYNKYQKANQVAKVLDRYDVIDIGSIYYEVFLSNYSKMAKYLGIGNYTYAKLDIKSAFASPESNNLTLGKSKSISLEELMASQDVTIEFPNGQNEISNRHSSDEHSDHTEIYDPTEELSDSECEQNQSRDNRKYSLKEGKAVVLWLKEHPLCSVAKEDQLSIFKTEQFKKHMQENSLQIRKAQSYINLYVNVSMLKMIV